VKALLAAVTVQVDDRIAGWADERLEEEMLTMKGTLEFAIPAGGTGSNNIKSA
jgi:hypothetical protein